MKTYKAFLTETGLSEGKLTPKELRKTFKTTGYLRVTAFADKMWNKEKFEKVGGGKPVAIKKIEYGEWEYYANVPADKKLFLKRFEEDTESKIIIVDPPMKLGDLEKTPEFGGQSGGGKGPTGAEWESLITHQFNRLIKNENADSAAKKIAEKFYPEYEKSAKAIATAFQKKLGASAPMEQYGAKASKSNLSKMWASHGAKNGTPKTDMFTKNFNISLKKAGGSQLASGTKEETLATFHAALEYMNESPETKKDIASIMEKIEKGFHKTALNYSKGDLDKLASGGKVKKGSKNITAAGMSDAEKKEMKKFTKTDKFHKTLNTELKEVLKLEENKKFMEWYCFEAMSGYKKFKSGSQSAASVCVTFDDSSWDISMINVTDGGKSSNLSGIPKISSELKAKAKGIKVYSAFKSSGTKPYSVLRLAGDDHSPDEHTYIDCTLDSNIAEELLLDEEVKKLDLNLTEDIVRLDEFALIKSIYGKLKGAAKDAAKWVTNFFKKVAERVRKALGKIAKLGKNWAKGLMQFLGIEFTASATVSSELAHFVNK